MSCQDWFTSIGTAASILGFVLTIVTLILTGTVKKALKNKRKQELYNQEYETNKQILDNLEFKNWDEFTYEDLKPLQKVFYRLSYCNVDFSFIEKIKIKAAIKYCSNLYENYNDISLKQKKKIYSYIIKINNFYQRRI